MGRNNLHMDKLKGIKIKKGIQKKALGLKKTAIFSDMYEKGKKLSKQAFAKIASLM